MIKMLLSIINNSKNMDLYDDIEDDEDQDVVIRIDDSKRRKPVR